MKLFKSISVSIVMGIACFAVSVSAAGNKPYKVTTSATSGGMITPRVANPHEGVTNDFSIRPNAGYRVVSVQGCGGTYNATTFTYTTAPADTDCIVRASFHEGSNQVPVVNPGQDITVNVGDTVTLTGTATDADGSIASTGWTQTAGTPVVLTNYGTTATFVAGQVTGATPLVFTFTATDNELATATGSIHVTITDMTVSWTTGGNTVSMSGTELHIDQAVTDNGGWAQSQWIPYDPAKKLIIERDVKVHYANAFHAPQFRIEFNENDGTFAFRSFRTQYVNMSWGNGGGCLPNYGFFLTKDHGNAHCSAYGGINMNVPPYISMPVTPIWDTWFTERMVYTPSTGNLDLYHNGVLVRTFAASIAPSSPTPQFRIYADAWGWFTGHYQYMRNLHIRQE